ncbi:MAG: aminotransferase class I/II-fold pyridoxal phosphate-dependent enzyme, partial [Burkholderiaceae bacterium]
MNPFPSRLPNVGTTIFTVMSRLASEHGAINLSQGFPDFSPPPLLLERAAHHMQAGANQYPPMAGVVPLREAIAEKVERLYGARYDMENEITVTAGATQALFTAIAASVRPGDEVIAFAPVYDSYIPAIQLAG